MRRIVCVLGFCLGVVTLNLAAAYGQGGDPYPDYTITGWEFEKQPDSKEKWGTAVTEKANKYAPYAYGYLKQPGEITKYWLHYRKYENGLWIDVGPSETAGIVGATDGDGKRYLQFKEEKEDKWFPAETKLVMEGYVKVTMGPSKTDVLIWRRTTTIKAP